MRSEVFEIAWSFDMTVICSKCKSRENVIDFEEDYMTGDYSQASDSILTPIDTFMDYLESSGWLYVDGAEEMICPECSEEAKNEQ